MTDIDITAPALPDLGDVSLHRDLLIGSQWRPARSGQRVTVVDPATEQPFTDVADAGIDDAMDALAAADGAAEAWRRTPPRRRAELLRRVYERLLRESDQLATIITREMGKPLAQAHAEVTYAAGYLRWYSEEAVRISGRYTVPEAGLGRIVTTREPVGTCLFITPWNFPLAMAARKIAPALAAGCTAVVKPAVQTPLSVLALAHICVEEGLPPGVLNVVVTSTSSALVTALMRDRRLQKVSFTGSTTVGKTLVEQSAHQLLRTSMELGGNAPFIVFPDADLDAAAAAAVTAKLRNNGEACTAANRFLVHHNIAEDFTDALTSAFQGLRVGPGTDPDTDVGPLIDARQQQSVLGLITEAQARGAHLSPATPVPSQGYFVAPTVISRLGSDAPILRQEIFGPIAPITTFASSEEAVTAANDTEYGLAAYLFTSQLDTAISVAEQLTAGMVAINQGTVSDVGAPFGGMRHSGFGREGGPEGLDEYLETKYLALNAGARPHLGGQQ